MKSKVFRGFFYLLGQFILAVGLTLNTKTGLGASAVVSVPNAISVIWGLKLGDVTFLSYILFVGVQLLVHIVRAEKVGRQGLALRLLTTFLQLPVSLVFTRVINVVSDFVPMLAEAYPDSVLGSLPGRIVVLLIAVILCGIGGAMTMNMRLAPNPADGLVRMLAELTGKTVGFTKNWFDLLNVSVTLVLGFVCTGGIVGVGIGTLVAVVGCGRTISVFNSLCSDQISRLSGLEPDVTAKAAKPA